MMLVLFNPLPNVIKFEQILPAMNNNHFLKVILLVLLGLIYAAIIIIINLFINRKFVLND